MDTYVACSLFYAIFPVADSHSNCAIYVNSKTQRSPGNLYD
jgi:hypothetical protein